MRMMTKFSTCFLKSARRKQWTFSKMPSLLLAETPGTYKSYIYLEEGIGISLMHLRPAILRIPVLGNVQFFDMSTFAFLCTSLTKLYSIAVLKFAGIWRTALSLYRCKGVAAMLLLELYPCWEKKHSFFAVTPVPAAGVAGSPVDSTATENLKIAIATQFQFCNCNQKWVVITNFNFTEVWGALPTSLWEFWWLVLAKKLAFVAPHVSPIVPLPHLLKGQLLWLVGWDPSIWEPQSGLFSDS